MYDYGELFGLYDYGMMTTNTQVEDYLRGVNIPEGYQSEIDITSLQMLDEQGILVNNEFVAVLNETNRYFYDLCKFVQNGGRVNPRYSDAELFDLAKTKLKSDINNAATINMYNDITYNSIRYSANERTREALMNVISTYRERVPSDDGEYEIDMDQPPITSKLPLPADFKWISADNEHIPFTYNDVLQLSALLQEQTYQTTFKAREFKDRLADMTTLDEVIQLREEVNQYYYGNTPAY